MAPIQICDDYTFSFNIPMGSDRDFVRDLNHDGVADEGSYLSQAIGSAPLRRLNVQYSPLAGTRSVWVKDCISGNRIWIVDHARNTIGEALCGPTGQVEIQLSRDLVAGEIVRPVDINASLAPAGIKVIANRGLPFVAWASRTNISATASTTVEITGSNFSAATEVYVVQKDRLMLRCEVLSYSDNILRIRTPSQVMPGSGRLLLKNAQQGNLLTASVCSITVR